MRVTRIVYSKGLNQGKYTQLKEQAQRLGCVRSLVWRRFGSIAGVGVSDRSIRDRWLADGTAAGFGLLANVWKETVRDAIADIAASRAAAKQRVRKAIRNRAADEPDRKRLFNALRYDRWTEDRWLCSQMRRHWHRGHNHTHNQIVVGSDRYNTFTLTPDGDVWLSVPGLERRRPIKIPLSSRVAPTGTLRLILRGTKVEVHYQIDSATMRSSSRPTGQREIGIDKGYSEVLTDSDGVRHGTELGQLLTIHSDRTSVVNARRAMLRELAEKAEAGGDRAKAARIYANNLGTVKKLRQAAKWEAIVRTVTFEAVHRVADKAVLLVTEDLSKNFASRKKLGKKMNRRLAGWTKGLTAEALQAVSDRRGSAVRLVNAAYTSQVIPGTDALGVRDGDELHCTECGAVWNADHAAAVNVLARASDPDIALWTPHTRVRQILRERHDRQRSRLPDQDSSTTQSCRCGERNIQTSAMRLMKGSSTA